MSDKEKVLNGYMFCAILALNILWFLLNYSLSSFDFLGTVFSLNSYISIVVIVGYASMLISAKKKGEIDSYWIKDTQDKDK